MFEMMQYSEMKLWEGEIPYLLPDAAKLAAAWLLTQKLKRFVE